MSEEQVIFIRGNGRSGTKNLVKHLGAHPDVAHININQVLPEELIDWTKTRLAPWRAQVTEEVVAQAVRAYFVAYGRAVAGQQGILLQKSTLNAHYLDMLLNYWPRGRIVYMVRHPIGWVEALLSADIHDYKGDYGGYMTVADALVRWKTETLSYLESSACGHDRLLQVRFEDLVSDINGTMGDIFHWLGLGQAELPPFGEPETFAEPFVLNESEREWILESTREVVERLGYKPGVVGVDIPSPLSGLAELYPERRLIKKPAADNAFDLLNCALLRAGRMGYKRVGLIGAGQFARIVCPKLKSSPVEITGIYDDNNRLWNSYICTYEIRNPECSFSDGAQALIPMTFVFESKMIERWRKLYGPKRAIVPLWSDSLLESLVSNS